MTAVTITSNGLSVEMKGPHGTERLGIRSTSAAQFSAYYDREMSRAIFTQFALMHLAAGHLPHTIESNIAVCGPMRRLIGAMYASVGRDPPKLNVPRLNAVYSLSRPLGDRCAVVAYSAGKDSLWNTMWAQDKFGATNVFPAHISGLNRANAAQERAYAKLQSEQCGFPLITLDMHNGSRLRGYSVMLSRDIFLSGILLPIALSLGASHIITEGFAEEFPTEPFSGMEKNIRFFNETLAQMGIPVSVLWKNKLEMDIVREMYEKRPEWMQHVCNCFSVPCYLEPRRRYWKRTAPSLLLYDSQCGSCVKCRITNLGRILYDTSAAPIAPEDVRAFLANTHNWLKTSGKKHQDMICGSFLRDLKRACELYGMEYKAAA